jgi:hypothetical protein
MYLEMNLGAAPLLLKLPVVCAAFVLCLFPLCC